MDTRLESALPPGEGGAACGDGADAFPPVENDGDTARYVAKRLGERDHVAGRERRADGPGIPAKELVMGELVRRSALLLGAGLGLLHPGGGARPS